MTRRLRAEGAVDLTLTLQPRKRQRKNRWHTAKGRVVGIRFSDAEYAMLEQRAKAEGLSPSGYLKRLATTQNHAA